MASMPRERRPQCLFFRFNPYTLSAVTTKKCHLYQNSDLSLFCIMLYRLEEAEHLILYQICNEDSNMYQMYQKHVFCIVSVSCLYQMYQYVSIVF